MIAVSYFSVFIYLGYGRETETYHIVSVVILSVDLHALLAFVIKKLVLHTDKASLMPLLILHFLLK